MRRRRPTPPPPVHLAFACVLFGLVAALAVSAAPDILTGPGASIGETLRRVLVRLSESFEAQLAFALAGSGASVLSYLGLFVPGLRGVVRSLLDFLLLGFGAFAGAGFGLASYGFYDFLRGDGTSLGASLARAILAGLASRQDALIFVLSGTLVGAAVTAYLLREELVRATARNTMGAITGSFVGLAVYSFAFTLMRHGMDVQASLLAQNVDAAFRSGTFAEYVFVALGAFVGYMVAKYRWMTYGVVALVSLVAVIVGYFTYTLVVTLPRVGPDAYVFSVVVFVAEALTLALVVFYSFYTFDVATRKSWRRLPIAAPFSAYFVPKVAFQVPTYNEPPELVIETLKSLLAVDYPTDRYLIMVADDSTKEESAAPLRAFCEQNDIQYIHRTERGGYKAGALNNALAETPPDVDLIAVVDADYQVEPEYLRETVGYFIEPTLAWVQTPQDYRNRDQSFLTRQYYLADAYFYRAVLPSRNDENSIIFCGTMGILRKSALVAVGGWNERSITEDADLSVRILYRRYQSLYVNKTYGRGLIPPTFEGYKKQHYRWAFGGAKILRAHWWRFLTGRFSLRQTFDFFVASFHWFEGLFILAIALALLALGLSDLMGTSLVTHHSREILLLGLVPVFLFFDGLMRLHMVLSRVLGLTVGDTVRVLGMWFSVKFSNMSAALKGLVGFNIPFVRTPKAPDSRIQRVEAIGRALNVTRFESLMSIVMALTATAILVRLADLATTAESLVTHLFLVSWLFYYALAFGAAPIYAYKSYVTFRPEEEILRRRVMPAAA